jgi:hypothetical protein
MASTSHSSGQDLVYPVGCIYPHNGFSLASVSTSSPHSPGSIGRPESQRRPNAAQRRWTSARCQPRMVAGCTMSRAPADSLRPRAARIRRSATRQRGRGAVRQRTSSSWRRTRSSRSRPAVGRPRRMKRSISRPRRAQRRASSTGEQSRRAGAAIKRLGVACPTEERQARRCRRDQASCQLALPVIVDEKMHPTGS